MTAFRVRLASALLLAATAPALAAKQHYTLTGRVVAIADGDTLTILDGSNTQHKIRLAGVDAPEKGQPFGTKARDNLADKVFKQEVRVEVIDVDRYHRQVGRIFLSAAEADAREHRRGLWADANPVPPWEWRRAKRQASKAAP